MLKKLVALVACLAATLAIAAVDVNKASESELDGIKGVGRSTSQLILSERKKAPFRDWDDLIARVKGIGESRAAKLSAEGLTVGGASFKMTAPGATMPKDKAASVKVKAATAQEGKK